VSLVGEGRVSPPSPAGVGWSTAPHRRAAHRAVDHAPARAGAFAELPLGRAHQPGRTGLSPVPWVGDQRTRPSRRPRPRPHYRTPGGERDTL